MWRRHYGELLFGSIVKHKVEMYNDLGTTHKGLNETDRSDV